MSDSQLGIDIHSANYKAGVCFSENNLKECGFRASRMLFNQKLNSTKGDSFEDKSKSEQEFLFGAWSALEEAAKEEQARIDQERIEMQLFCAEQAKKRQRFKKRREQELA